jgi:hypothetical protein
MTHERVLNVFIRMSRYFGTCIFIVCLRIFNMSQNNYSCILAYERKSIVDVEVLYQCRHYEFDKVFIMKKC